MDEERKILNRLIARLKSARATVMLEFAFIAPLVVTVAAFAADFTNILRTEQQLEIASRLAADVEAHTADYYAKGESPGTAAKLVAKSYLANVAHTVDGIGSVYMKGGCEAIKNPITFVVDWLRKFLKGETFDEDDGSPVWKLFINVLGKILGGIANFLTFRTVDYLIDIVPHDREVKITTAAYIDTVLPAGAYSLIGMPERGGAGGGRIGVGQFAPDIEGGAASTAWNMKMVESKRHRVYCYMPVVDAVPVAPETYVRKLKAWCAKQPFLKGLVN